MLVFPIFIELGIVKLTEGAEVTLLGGNDREGIDESDLGAVYPIDQWHG